MYEDLMKKYGNINEITKEEFMDFTREEIDIYVAQYLGIIDDVYGLYDVYDFVLDELQKINHEDLPMPEIGMLYDDVKHYFYEILIRDYEVKNKSLKKKIFDKLSKFCYNIFIIN